MAQKISVIIPNFNGRQLLEKNLPQILNACENYEVIIVDDASKDDSVSFIKKNYKHIRLIEQKINKGFSHTANTGIKSASGDLVLLLNSDILPKPSFLDSAITHFKDGKVFAVGLLDKSHENSKIVERGRGGAAFKRGFLNHFALPAKSGQTLWVSGGSSLIDKKKFTELEGFDEIYNPFYWEDIDLGYRAYKAGYICLFDPKSKVDHFHEEGSIKKNFTPFYIRKTSYRNQFIFVWKNISDYSFLVQHLLWLPLHILKSILARDWAFLLGFAQAIFKLPQLIVSSQMPKAVGLLADKELIKKFERP